jgi:hypothetical protein
VKIVEVVKALKNIDSTYSTNWIENNDERTNVSHVTGFAK